MFLQLKILSMFASIVVKDEANGYPTVSTTNKIRMLLKPVDENEYFNSPTWIKLKVSLEVCSPFQSGLSTL